jgi:hypothetical protein
MTTPTATDLLAAALDGVQVPGGCATCDAYQTARLVIPADDHGGEAILLRVHHDADCPTLLRRMIPRPLLKAARRAAT